MSTVIVPDWASRNNEWAPVIHLLMAPSLRDRAMRHVHFDEARIDFEQLLDDARQWSRFERFMVRAAYSYWNGGWTEEGDVYVRLIDFRGLDTGNQQRLIEALQIAAGFRTLLEVQLAEHGVDVLDGDKTPLSEVNA